MSTRIPLYLLEASNTPMESTAAPYLPEPCRSRVLLLAATPLTREQFQRIVAEEKTRKAFNPAYGESLKDIN